MAVSSKTNNQENLSLGGKKGKKASVAQRNTSGSMYTLLADDDGNAKTAKEFDDIPHAVDEVFFKINDELTGDERKVAEDRVELLNFIHKELFLTRVNRCVPAPTENIVDDTEIYHQADYNGRKIDIGVHFYQGVNGVWTARAFAKFADAELDDDEYGVTIWADHAANAAEVKKDKGSKVVAGLTKFYWAPRWNYVIRYLRLRMETYTRDGSTTIDIVEPSPPGAEGAEDDSDPTEIEFGIQVPSGCTGAIIGAKGAKINELKSLSGVKDIKMPERTEPRPKARELVTVIIIGRKSAVKKACGLIDAIKDEWLNAPRPPRDGSNGGSGGFQQPSQGFAQIEEGSGGNYGGGDAFQDDGGNGNWADSVNDAADNFGGGGGGGDNW